MNLQNDDSSIFDSSYKALDPSSSFSWRKPSSKFKLKKSKVIYSGTLQELHTTSAGMRSPKYYVATPTQFLKFTDTKAGTPEAALELPTPRLELFKDDATWKYGFSLTAHDVTLKFVTGSKEEAHKWYAALKTKCNVCALHFSKSYSVQRTVKRSSYYKIQYALNNETKTRCVVKSISKPHIIDYPIRLVLLHYKNRRGWRTRYGF